MNEKIKYCGSLAFGHRFPGNINLSTPGYIFFNVEVDKVLIEKNSSLRDRCGKIFLATDVVHLKNEFFSGRKMTNHIDDSELVIQLPDWIKQLRRSEIVDRVQKDPRSVAETLLGISFTVAREQVTEWGQANFDEPWKDLSPADRVLLYAYCHQLRHLEELTAAFHILFHQTPPKENLVVIDVGCGPFTGGLAFAGEIGSESQFDYIGIDHSQAMRSLGETLASATKHLNGVYRQWSPDISSVDWGSAPNWRPVIIIVSYLLASRTLDVETLISELEILFNKIGRGTVTILYTNSPQSEANRNFPTFRKALQDADFELRVNDEGMVKIEKQPGEIRTYKLRYALFFRPEQNILSLGGD